MCWSRRKAAKPSEEWLHSISTNTSLIIDRSSTSPEKQQLRILNDEGARAFAGVFSEDKVVTELTISGPEFNSSEPTYMTEEGFKTIGRVMSANQTVIDLKLREHKITHESGIAFAENLAANNKTLKFLTLWKSRIDDMTAYEIVTRVSAIPTLEKINLGENVLTEQGKTRIEQWILDFPRRSLVISMF